MNAPRPLANGDDRLLTGALPTLFHCYQPVDEYQRMVRMSHTFEPRLRLEPLDAFLLHQIAQYSPMPPAIIDWAGDATCGCSTILWWSHPGIECLISVESALGQNGRAAWKPLVSAAARSMYLDESLATFVAERPEDAGWMAIQSARPPLAPAIICLEACENNIPGLHTRVAQCFEAFSDPLVVLWPMGKIGASPVVDMCLDFGRSHSLRIAALREQSAFLAASQVALLCRQQNSCVDLILRRIAGLFEGNFQFLTLANALADSALQVKAVQQQLQTGRPAAKCMDYLRLVSRVRRIIEKVVPPSGRVLVVSKGDPSFMDLNNRAGWHFPRTEQGIYAGHHPQDCKTAIQHLEALRHSGAEFIVFPATMFWWFTHYRDFLRHLDERYQRIVDDQDTCVIYRLSIVASKAPTADSCLTQDGDGSAVCGSKNGRHDEKHPQHETVELQLASPRQESPGGAASPGLNGDEGMLDAAARLIAFYLPQFHPIPENNEWWGNGFTEWTNVAKAQPLFPGHYQPHLPGELGFYDLRVSETRCAQAELARQHQIHGFCYYHYWFNGKRLLQRPFEEVLRSGEPNFPFCLCWANEPWTRRWDGETRDVLQPQTYSAQDDQNHIRALLPAISDSRAICVERKPLFLMYRSEDHPARSRLVDVWQNEAAREGLKGLFLVAVETPWAGGRDATQDGFDACLLFQPQWKMPPTVPRKTIEGKEKLWVYDYDAAWPVLANPDDVPYRRYHSVVPCWDNAARAGDRAFLLHGSTPAAYEQWLRVAIRRVQSQPLDHRLVFINAWNEWAEGCHLEPDRLHGRGYLEATQRAVTAHYASRRITPVLA